MGTENIQYPAAARYIRNGRSDGRSVRIEKPEHIGIALHRLAGMNTPHGHDHLEISTITERRSDSRVIARLYADDLESLLA